MTDSARKPRRWPWIIACVVFFFGGLFGGLVLAAAGMAHMYNVPCPPLFRPTQAEMEAAERGPGVFPPRGLSRPMEMPRAGRLARVRGEVEVLARVEADGSVSRTELVRSSGFCPYDVEALKGVRHWKFEPARRLGEAFTAWAPVRVIFSLEPAPRPVLPPRGDVKI